MWFIFLGNYLSKYYNKFDDIKCDNLNTEHSVSREYSK